MENYYSNGIMLYDVKPGRGNGPVLNDSALLPHPGTDLTFTRITAQNKNIPATGGYTFLLCLQGHGALIAGNMVYPTTPGRILLLSPGYAPAFNELADDALVFALTFSADFLQRGVVQHAHIEGLIAGIDKNIAYRDLGLERIHAIKELMLRVEKELAVDKAYHDEMEQVLFVELMLQSYRLCSEPAEAEQRETRSKQLARQFIMLADDHFLKLRTVQDYAEKLYVSPKHLSEVVKQETGAAPLHHIHQRLFTEAQFWLSSAQLTIKEVAEKLGFDTPSHFSRFFKQFTGHNPTQYVSLIK